MKKDERGDNERKERTTMNRKRTHAPDAVGMKGRQIPLTVPLDMVTAECLNPPPLFIRNKNPSSPPQYTTLYSNYIIIAAK
jgi:hypothetical protein